MIAVAPGWFLSRPRARAAPRTNPFHPRKRYCGLSRENTMGGHV